MPVVPSKQVGANTATEPLISNLVMPLADTEYSHVLNDAVKQVLIRCRNSAKIQLSFEVGESDITYLTIPKGVTLNLENIKFHGKVIYVRSNVASIVLEILELI